MRPENPEAADLIIVNTCGFIKSAQEEAVNTLLQTTGRISGQNGSSPLAAWLSGGRRNY